jgi:hypothetical protein
MATFIWTDRNLEAATKHGVAPADAGYVVSHVKAPWPEPMEQKVWRVWGRTEAGEYVEVICRSVDDTTTSTSRRWTCSHWTRTSASPFFMRGR